MYCLELIKFDVSNASYYVEVANGALLGDVMRSWKMIIGTVMERSWKSDGKSVGTFRVSVCACVSVRQGG